MDKIGPIARGVEDTALVLAAIHGRDGHDPTVHDMPFDWPPSKEISQLRIGYVADDEGAEDSAAVDILRRMGAKLIPIELPPHPPAWAMTMILDVEAATVFQELTQAGITEGLNSWPGTFRRAHFVSAVDYLQANRLRTLLIREMEEAISGVDVYVGGKDLAITNLTGHPSIGLPNGFAKRGGRETPTAVTLSGHLYGETTMLAAAHAIQQATDFHLRRPPSDLWERSIDQSQ